MAERYGDAEPWVREALNRILRTRERGLDPRPVFHQLPDRREEGIEVWRAGRRVVDCWNAQTSIRLGIFDHVWSEERLHAFAGVDRVAQQKEYLRAHVISAEGVDLISAILRTDVAEPDVD